MQLLTTEKGFALNLYINGTIATKSPADNDITFNISTDYPVSGDVAVTIKTSVAEKFRLLVRNPHWSKNTEILVNGTPAKICDGYVSMDREWKDGDTVNIKLDMRTQAIYPIPYGSQILMNKVIWGYNYVVPTFDKEDPVAKNHIALRRGPVMLAQDNRLGYSVDDAITVKVNDDGYVDTELAETDIYPNIYAANIPLSDGSSMLVTDYSSAGKLWTEESKMAVWMLTK
jgi:hypothetical protein